MAAGPEGGTALEKGGWDPQRGVIRGNELINSSRGVAELPGPPYGIGLRGGGSPGGGAGTPGTRSLGVMSSLTIMGCALLQPPPMEAAQGLEPGWARSCKEQRAGTPGAGSLAVMSSLRAALGLWLSSNGSSAGVGARLGAAPGSGRQDPQRGVVSRNELIIRGSLVVMSSLRGSLVVLSSLRGSLVVMSSL